MNTPLSDDAQQLISAAREGLAQTDADRERRERLVLAAVGISAVAVANTAGVAAASHASASVAQGAGAVAVTTKWIGLALALVSVGVGGYWIGRRDERVERAAQVASSRSRAPDSMRSADLVKAEAEHLPVAEALAVAPVMPAAIVRSVAARSQTQASRAVEGSPPAAHTEPEPSASVVAPAAGAVVPPASTNTIEREADLIHRVRGALQSGAPQAALLLLAEYDAQFADGTLAREAALLRIRAACTAGQTDQARTVLQRVLAHGDTLAQSTFDRACASRP